jgi:hypothetical protein
MCGEKQDARPLPLVPMIWFSCFGSSDDGLGLPMVGTRLVRLLGGRESRRSFDDVRACSLSVKTSHHRAQVIGCQSSVNMVRHSGRWVKHVLFLGRTVGRILNQKRCSVALPNTSPQNPALARPPMACGCRGVHAPASRIRPLHRNVQSGQKARGKHSKKRGICQGLRGKKALDKPIHTNASPLQDTRNPLAWVQERPLK